MEHLGGEIQGIIRSGDIIPAGPNSAKIGRTLQGMANMEILPGREAVSLIKKRVNTLRTRIPSL